MSTFGPVSLRPDQDDILFSHKEEELLLMMDRSSELGKGRGAGIDVIAVGRASARAPDGGRDSGHPLDLGSRGRAGAGGRGNGGGRGVSGGFFGSGGKASGRLSSGVRGGEGGASRSPQNAIAVLKPLTGGSGGVSVAPSLAAAPPAYSTLHRQHQSPTNGPGVGIGDRGRELPTRGAHHGVRRSDEGIGGRTEGSLNRSPAQAQQQIRSRPAR